MALRLSPGEHRLWYMTIRNKHQEEQLSVFFQQVNFKPVENII